VNAGIVTCLIGLGAGAIALWIEVRFPHLAPQEMAKAVLHAAASLAVGYATSPAIQALVAYEDHRLTLLAIFGLAFPSIVYCLLAGIWVITLAQRSLSRHLR
jgi:uncharacterized membrane protein